ncbi:MAG: redoxin family protein [Chloroflexi bacterium]|nr:redoxin family protein [Chloroflexota bacterium]MDA1174259.1 redoxin family protein [Chloroflexota bacterium]
MSLFNLGSFTGLFSATLVAGLVLAACGNGTDAPDDRASANAPTQVSPATDEPSVLEAVTPSQLVGGSVGSLAPDFAGIDTWINSDALSIANLKGRVVLVDFWTYTCVNCIRTLPYLQEWHEKYKEHGLEIVGVHTPEFDFEKITANVQNASDDLGVVWPVAQDNDFGTWRAYSNQFWPAKYLIDKDGVVRYTHFGEGGYDETELAIRELLGDAGAELGSIGRSDDDGPEVIPAAYTDDPEARITRELYGGWNRNYTSTGQYIGHASYYDLPETTHEYVDPGEHFNQFLFLDGVWTSGLESIKHGRATEAYEDYIGLKFSARSANAVIDLEEGVEPFKVKVTIEDKNSGAYRPLTEDEAGADVAFEEGETFLNVDAGRMYFVVSLPDFDDRELKFSSNSPDFGLFAMTFGAYELVD